MKKSTKIVILCVALLMIMQAILPTISQAVNLNIQFERPYNDDDGNGTVGDDVYTVERDATQTVFKIGEQDAEKKLSFNEAYYCLRSGLGFGSTNEIVQQGVNYEKLADLSNKTAVMSYFEDVIGHELTEASYNAICWLADNMYLPKSEHAEDLKAQLLKDANEYAKGNGLLNLGESMLVEESLLTDDDIEVVQQMALWYFTNYDENGGGNSLSLDDTVNLANLLKINDQSADNDTTVLYNKYRAKQIHLLYKYLVNTAKTGTTEKVVEKIELDKTLQYTIQEKVLPNPSLNVYVVGPFKINETQKGNVDYKFSYELKYKTSEEPTKWSNIDIDNQTGTVYLSLADGTAIDRQNNLQIKDMIGGNEFYITILKDVVDIVDMTDFELNIKCDTHYYITNAEILVADVDDQPVLKIEKVKPEVRNFDLALRKFITATNGEEIDTRIPEIYLESLREGTTAIYNHPKNPIYLKAGETIIYTIRIYNEGDVDGYATEVTDYLCDDLELVENSDINTQYGWTLTDGKLSTNYLANTLIKAYNPEVIGENVNVWQQAKDGTDGLYYADLKVECRIKDTATLGITLPNVAEITKDKAVEITVNENDEKIETEIEIDDRDSVPESLQEADIRSYESSPWYEDDDDYERVIIEDERVFDLSLRKYISNIERKGENVNFASRVPQIDTAPLKQNISTAKYSHSKEPLTVKQGDIITYKLRIYNEGDFDGYATEIRDYIPEGLGLLVGYSKNSNWLISSNSVENQPLVGEKGWYKTEQEVPTNGILEGEDLANITIVTGKDGSLEIRDYLSLEDKLIKKYGSQVEDGDLYQISSNNEDDGLFYKELEVTCIVLAPNTYEGNLVNIAEISVDKAVETDENGIETEVDIDDRDSTPDSLTEEQRHAYENNPWYHDDDDYEPVQLKYFDLALRKFITGVNETEVDTRIPKPVISEDGNIKYVHDKTPVEVVDNDNVTYTIRVYNEGTIAGYAEEVEDDIPEGLIFLPNDKTNKAYGWKMYYYDEQGELVETENEEEAEVIRTTYLSEEKGTVDETTGINSNLLKVFDRQTMEEPDYRDLKVVFKLEQNDIPKENEDGIIVNKAHITADSDGDEDSIPDKWNDPEDDQDKEYIYVQKFDLALFKWVTQTIVTVDGKTTTTETGFKPNVGKTEASPEGYRANDEEEPIASVTIDKKKLNSTVVKFVYNIRVVNEGDIEGYVTEVTDYIPEGLKFVQEDNPLWSLEEGNTITTRALETTLLKPGEGAEVPVTFTWINDQNNLGVKTNIAAITEDYNEKGIPDEDSKPGNEDIPNYDKEQEDDDDFALVILTLKTGTAISYIWLMLLTVTIIALGAILIKKYVL